MRGAEHRLQKGFNQQLKYEGIFCILFDYENNMAAYQFIKYSIYWNKIKIHQLIFKFIMFLDSLLLSIICFAFKKVSFVVLNFKM